MGEEDEETLKQEQAVLDDHDDRMNEIMDRLTQLGNTKSTPIVVALPMSLETAAEPSQLLRRRLNQMESTLRLIKSTVESLTHGPDLDTSLVWQLEEQVGRINAEHSDLTRDILSLEHEGRDPLGLSLALSITLSTRADKYKDCSESRLLLNQPKELRVASNCQR